MRIVAHSRPRPHLSHSWESGNLSLMMSIIPNSRVAADPLDNRIMDITNKANRICSAVEAIAKLKHESVGGLMHTVVNLLRGAENLLLDYIRVKHGTSTKRDPMPIMLKSLAHSLHRIGLLNCVYRNNMVCYFGGGNFPANWGHTSASSLPP
ncbi:Glutathione S-transferase Mu [Dirofilaria immitis]